jgi:glucokinase
VIDVKVLAGDIGGTNTRLALFEGDGDGFESIAEADFPSRKFDGLEEIVRRFLGSGPPDCADACFGIAGPVRDRRSETTNLPWVVEAGRLEENLRIKKVSLVNDLEANAHGLSILDKADFAVLLEGRPDARGNRAIISAGTGLGEAGLYWDGNRHRPFATEGGHTEFAPTGEIEMALLQHLSQRYCRVSWERVLSGPGLVNIYRFLLENQGTEEPAWLKEQMERTDPAAAVSNAALQGKSTVCKDALDLFIALYGAEAGNLALKLMATGGVFLGGGIAPRICDRLRGPTFLDRFLGKGRMRPLVESMPVQVILNDRTALLGAARYAVLARRGA